MKNYKKFFNNEKIEMLFKQHDKSYVIDLIKNKKLSFMFLYNLAQNELTELRRYFNNILIKEWIKHFVSSTKILIFFIFKKNERLRLYVDYKNLNVIIIKNWHSLSLIMKTLNRFNNFKQFTKLDFKNVYHWICIKRDDEWKTIFRTRYEHFKY